MSNTGDGLLHLHPGLVAIVVIDVIGLVMFQQSCKSMRNQIPFQEPVLQINHPTFDDELVVENALQGAQQERVQRQVADFPRFKVAVDLFEILAPLKRLFQLLQDQPMFLYVPMIELKDQGLTLVSELLLRYYYYYYYYHYDPYLNFAGHFEQ